MAPILQALTDPTLAYALFIVGCCALLTEAAHPGAFLPGISGAICLLLALVGLSFLSVNWLSLLLIVAAMSLFALDVKLTTHGGLTVAGLAAFAAGSFTLYNVPGNHGSVAVPLPLIVVLTLGGAALTTFLVRAAMNVHHGPSVNGPQRLLGQTAIVTTALAPGGVVRVGGEFWSARLCTGPAPALPPGQRVRVVGRHGLTLEVEPVSSAGGGALRSA